MCGMRTLVTVVTLFLLSAATATSNDDNVVHARDGGPAPQENCVKLSSYAIQSGSGFPTYTQARPSIQLDVAECAKSNQASVDDGRMHVPLKLIFDGQELETSTITLPTGGAGTFQGEESWMKRRLWLPDIGGVHDLEVIVDTPVPQHLYFVYEKLQASAKPYISFPPPNGSYIFGRSTSPFVKVQLPRSQTLIPQPCSATLQPFDSICVSGFPLNDTIIIRNVPRWVYLACIAVAIASTTLPVTVGPHTRHTPCLSM
jgi:hypothetical protein